MAEGTFRQTGQASNMEWLSYTVKDTETCGRLLGELSQAGDVICLDGDLGAGKTVLTRGIARGLGLDTHIISPTFTILQEYPVDLHKRARLSLYHFDVYRLGDAEAFYQEGLDEYFNKGGLCVLEWGERVLEALPAQTLFIRMHALAVDQPEQRLLLFNWPGQSQRLAKLREALNENISS